MTYQKLKRTVFFIVGGMLTIIVLWNSLVVPVVGQGSTDPPGETTPKQAETLNSVPGGPGFVTGPASAFRARSSSTQYTVNGPRLTTTSGSTYYDAPVLLPHGAEITKFILYYRDNSSQDLTAQIFRVPLPGRDGSYIAGVSSSGTSTAVRYSATTSINHSVVDLQQNAYYIRLQLPADTELEVNGYRIDYNYPVALPYINK